MKLATAKELRAITGKDRPQDQFDVLTQQLGVRPVFIDGRLRVYQEVIAQAMLPGKEIRTVPGPKPKLNI